jgi:subtilisin family serine protease
MPKRWMTLGIALVAAAGLTAVAGTAAGGDETGGADVAKFARVDASLLASAKGFVPAALSDKPVTVMLQLSGDPVAVEQVKAAKQGKNLSDDEKAALRAQLKSKQDALTGSINAAGGEVVGQLQSAYNGVQVTVPQKNISQLASLPGVVAVHSVPTFRPSNTHGVPYIGGDQAWGSYGRTGAGVKVAVIDTGIDYTHADFGGPGTVAAFDAAAKASTAPPDKRLFGRRAPKVKGGYDFVGDDYDADSKTAANKVPHPDPNPLDCNGHGSHTAGTAVGFGVLANGTTYGGPYNATTISGHSWNVGPGVAPKADLYAYRVFGCEGSSNVVDLAIDQAVADGVDVISMSLGSSFGGQDDPTTVAAENAAAAGIAVVASAGNSGPSGYIVGSPSTGSHVLSVAAIDASVPQYAGARMNLSTGQTVDTIIANGAALPSGSFGVKVLKNADGSIALGCDPAAYAGSAGKIVVTTRGTCARVARAIYGQKAGAAAVVMVNNSSSIPPFEGPITSNPDTASARATPPQSSRARRWPAR